ncbi:mitochondrial 54S ribosomal protein bL21m [Kockiozyma suomiensis]|uniref:mitochondrial 54S ribosomal protein bL21m n=1 Tax=Kockiozyma suomiensis TaxID=1337062 RepID=UPI003343A43C
MAAPWRSVLNTFCRTAFQRPVLSQSRATFSRFSSSSSSTPSVSLPSPLTSSFPAKNTTIAQPTAEQLTAAFKSSSHLNHSLQTPLYATIRIHKHQFLVSVGDSVTLPFRLKDVQVGDVIRLTQIETLGSRKFTWKGSPFIDDERCVVRARVVEQTKEPMRIKIRKKQRTRRTKHIISKHAYTVLTIAEVGYNA